MNSRTSLVFVALALVGAVTPKSAAAQQDQPPPCSSPEYRQFDFWVGEWEVENANNGNPAGKNTIESILGGCALQESWVGAGGTSGYSYNIYDARTGLWHQTWVDGSGQLLQLDGRIEDGKMVLSGERPGADAEVIMHTVTWEPLDDGRVRQHWTASRDGGESWATLFDGIYVPASNQ